MPCDPHDPRCSRQCDPERRAYTLLELTVVLMLVGVLLAIAAPHLAAMRDSAAVRAAVGDVGTAFSYARQQAVVRRAPVAVIVDTTQGQLVVRTMGSIVSRRTVRLSYGVSLGSNRDSVVYDAHGLGFGLSNLTLTVKRGSFVDTLTMSRLGRLRY